MAQGSSQDLMVLLFVCVFVGGGGGGGLFYTQYIWKCNVITFGLLAPDDHVS